MATITELMLAVRDRCPVFYHKDTNQFDYCPVSQQELKNLSLDEELKIHDTNNFMLPSYEEINHNEIMRFFVRDCVEDKAVRKKLFGILRRTDYMDAFLEEIRVLNLYEEFDAACGDIYYQIFTEWEEKNELSFK